MQTFLVEHQYAQNEQKISEFEWAVFYQGFESLDKAKRFVEKQLSLILEKPREWVEGSVAANNIHKTWTMIYPSLPGVKGYRIVEIEIL